MAIQINLEFFLHSLLHGIAQSSYTIDKQPQIYVTALWLRTSRMSIFASQTNNTSLKYLFIKQGFGSLFRWVWKSSALEIAKAFS